MKHLHSLTIIRLYIDEFINVFQFRLTYPNNYTTETRKQAKHLHNSILRRIFAPELRKGH